MVRLRSSPRFLHDKVIYLAFPPTLTTTALDRCSLGWFEARSCKPTLRDLPSYRASSASISSALIGDSPDWYGRRPGGLTGRSSIRSSRPEPERLAHSSLTSMPRTCLGMRIRNGPNFTAITTTIVTCRCMSSAARRCWSVYCRPAGSMGEAYVHDLGVPLCRLGLEPRTSPRHPAGVRRPGRQSSRCSRMTSS